MKTSRAKRPGRRIATQSAAAPPQHEMCRATVVIPLHNHAEWITPLLESLFDQWQPSVSLLIIDDGSIDGSYAAAMAALESRPDIPSMILRNERALHHGVLDQVIQYTTSEIIIKSDSDDVALPGRIQAILDVFETDPHCRLVTTNAVVIAEDGHPTGIYNATDPDCTVTGAELWAGRTWDPRWLGATMAFHRTVLTAFPRIDPDLCPYGFDIVLPFRAGLLGRHHYLARPLVGWRNHPRNTHRLSGAGDATLAGQERYGALLLMALAQRIRDARHVKLQLTDDSAGDIALSLSNEVFLSSYDDWCRLRNRLAKSANGETAPMPLPPATIVASLEPGRHLFGGEGRLATAAETWRGFYTPEVGHIWTSNAALMVFRTSPKVGRLLLTMASSPLVGKRQAYVSVGFGQRVEVNLIGDAVVVVEIPVIERWRADHIILMIETPDARQLQDVDLVESDPRLFGVMLLSLDLVDSG